MKRPALSTHNMAIVAVCRGVSSVSDHYQFALMLSAKRRKRTSAAGTSAAAFGATLSSAGGRDER